MSESSTKRSNDVTFTKCAFYVNLTANETTHSF